MQSSDGRFAARQSQGRRDYQEDDYGLLDGREPDAGGDEHAMLVVADGMGGHVGGDAASSIVVKTFIDIYQQATGPSVDRLRACLTEANTAIAAAIGERPELDGMGSTLLAAVITQQGLDWISVGDSPLWLFRDGQLTRLNADHSMAPVLADMVATGRLTEEEAAADSRQHALRSAVTGEEITLVDTSSQPLALTRGDRVLLASDGLMTLDDRQITDILQDTLTVPPDTAAAALIDAVEAADRPRQDNITVLLYHSEADRGTSTATTGASAAFHTSGATVRRNRINWRPGTITNLLRLSRIAIIALLLALLGYWLIS